jgi:D-alanine-D-alanine ligase
MKTLVLYTLPPEMLSDNRRLWEFELSDAAYNVARALRNAIVRGVNAWPGEIVQILSETRPDVVFNLCEAPLGRPDLEAHLAAFLEWAGVKFTGCGSETLVLCRRKDLTNPVLRAAGVPVPADIDPADPRFPCVVKPSSEDGSAGIHDHSLCHDVEQLHYAISHLKQPAIVQEFLPGREFAVSLWGRTSPDYCSIGETFFERGLQLITYAAKWDCDSDAWENSPMSYAAPIEEHLRLSITQTARAAWRTVGARHSLRVDIRLDSEGIPRVLDVNPNPAISPGVGICRAVQEAGWRWEDFVKKLVEWA